jgi:hypothetical protein
MKLKFIILIAMSICFKHGNAKDLPKFGEINKSDFENKTISFAPNAEAVYLFNIGDDGYQFYNYQYTYNGFRVGFQNIKKRRFRIKILNEKGLNKALLKIHCWKKDEIDLKASVFNLENGNIKETKYNPNEVNVETIVDNFHNIEEYALPIIKEGSVSGESDISEPNEIKKELRTFQFPNVKIGSIIDVEYTKTTHYNPSKHRWEFQKDIPVLYSHYKFSHPDYYIYRTRLNGSSHIKAKPKKKNRVSFKEYYAYFYEYEADSLKPFKKGKHMLGENNYKSNIGFEMSSRVFPDNSPEHYARDWKFVSQFYLQHTHFGYELSDGDFIEESFEDSLDNLEGIEKVLAVFEHVKNRIKWNGINSNFCSDDLEDIYEKGIGNSADINLMIIAILKEFDYKKVYPVILSTRDNIIIDNNIPTASGFNYVIAAVKVNGRFLFLDATNKFAKAGDLPERCLSYNTKRLLSKKYTQEIQVTNNHYFYNKNAFTLKVNKNGISGTKTSIYKDLSASRKREEILTSNKSKIYNSINNLNDYEAPLILKSNIDNKNQTNRFQFRLNDYVNINKYQFELESRNYDLNFIAPIFENNTIYINLPKGYTVENLPEKLHIEFPGDFGQFQLVCQQNGNTIIISSSLRTNRSHLLCEHYKQIKNNFNTIFKAFSKNITIKHN